MLLQKFYPFSFLSLVILGASVFSPLTEASRIKGANKLSRNVPENAPHPKVPGLPGAHHLERNTQTGEVTEARIILGRKARPKNEVAAKIYASKDYPREMRLLRTKDGVALSVLHRRTAKSGTEMYEFEIWPGTYHMLPMDRVTNVVYKDNQDDGVNALGTLVITIHDLNTGTLRNINVAHVDSRNAYQNAQGVIARGEDQLLYLRGIDYLMREGRERIGGTSVRNL